MQVTPTWTAARKRLGSAARWAAREALRVPLASRARIWPSRSEISEISATLNNPPSMMKTRTSAASPRVSFTAGQCMPTAGRPGVGRPAVGVRGARCGPRRGSRGAPGGQMRPSSATASRSSTSSPTEASIRLREKSEISRPWTISYAPSRVVTGKEEMMPAGTP